MQFHYDLDDQNTYILMYYFAPLIKDNQYNNWEDIFYSNINYLLKKLLIKNNNQTNISSYIAEPLTKIQDIDLLINKIDKVIDKLSKGYRIIL